MFKILLDSVKPERCWFQAAMQSALGTSIDWKVGYYEKPWKIIKIFQKVGYYEDWEAYQNLPKGWKL